MRQQRAQGTKHKIKTVVGIYLGLLYYFTRKLAIQSLQTTFNDPRTAHNTAAVRVDAFSEFCSYNNKTNTYKCSDRISPHKCVNYC